MRVNSLSGILCKLRLRKHLFENWEYAESGSCIQKKSCKRCGTECTDTRKTHNWKSLGYLQEGSCRKKTICERCKEEKFETIHIWNEWKTINSDTRLRSCKRCPVEEKETKCPECSGTGEVVDYENTTAFQDYEEQANAIGLGRNRGGSYDYQIDMTLIEETGVMDSSNYVYKTCPKCGGSGWV